MSEKRLEEIQEYLLLHYWTRINRYNHSFNYKKDDYTINDDCLYQSTSADNLGQSLESKYWVLICTKNEWIKGDFNKFNFNKSK